MPPRLKRSGTHDKSTNNHAAGLAPPSRRIVKQKSNSILNGTTNGRPRPTAPSAQPDVAGIVHRDDPSTPSPSSDVPVNEIPSDAKMGASQSHPNGRARTASGSSEDDLEAHGSSSRSSEDHTANGSPLKIDVNKAAANKCSLGTQKTAFATATTILKACPLWDVIAILIILLQLPPTMISIVQFLFAFLTFVSPTSGTSLANLPSINEVLMGASGAPSFQTIVFLDGLFLLLFVFLWAPAQNLALDLAQAVIAISLGGAASSKGGTSASIFSCLGILGISHIIRWDFVRQLGFNFIWTGLVKAGLQPAAAPPMLSRYSDRVPTSYGWPRKVVSVHILAQGVARLVRKWYIVNELSSNKKLETDGSMSALGTPRTTSSFSESSVDIASSASTDGRPPGPSPATREKDTISSNKRKKKQANHARSQQPFWAALANAKVTFLKELEHQQASSDALEAQAMDMSHIGNANFKSGKDRVWIREVGSSEISFGVCLPSLATEDKEMDRDQSDRCVKRFRIRLNKTAWSSTRVIDEALGVQVAEDILDVWSGKIFGLTASTNYICEFVRVSDGSTIFTTHITTQPAPFTEQAPNPAVQPPQSLRPLSPTTTLRNSIKAAEQQLENYRNRIKKNKRDHKNLLISLQREVDSLNGRLSSNGGNDDRQRQKVRQLEQSIQQAKAKEAEILHQVEDLCDVPADELQESNSRRANWQQEKDRLSEAQKEFDSYKAEVEREIAAVKSEMTSLIQKRQKFEQRQAKFKEQRERLLSEASQSQEAQSRRFQERETEARTRADTERRFIEQTTLLERDAQNWWALGGQHESQARQLEELYNRNLQQQSMPTTPEGPLPGTRSINHHASHQSGFPSLQPSFQFPSLQGLPDPTMMPFRHSDPLSSMYPKSRGRSSSMLSGVSGFTDDLDEYPLAPHHHVYHLASSNGVLGRDSRKSSAGSGGSASTGSGNSSTRDPMSPPPKTLNPLAKSLNSPLSPPPSSMR